MARTAFKKNFLCARKLKPLIFPTNLFFEACDSHNINISDLFSFQSQLNLTAEVSYPLHRENRQNGMTFFSCRENAGNFKIL